MVDTIAPQTSAAHSGLKVGDIVLSVENKPVTNPNQVSKIIKSISGVNFCIRIERVATNYTYRVKYEETENKTPIKSTNNIEEENVVDNFVMVENTKLEDNIDPSKRTKSISSSLDKIKSVDKVPKLISCGNENMSKFAQTIGNFSLRKRKIASEKVTAGDSNKSTPSHSVSGTPQHCPKTPVPATNVVSSKKQFVTELPEIIRTDSSGSDVEVLSGVVEIFKGKEVFLNSIMAFNDEHTFQLKDGSKYLNINAWGILPTKKDILLGYINIPLTEVLNECLSSMLGHYTKSYSFLPPNNNPPNRY